TPRFRSPRWSRATWWCSAATRATATAVRGGSPRWRTAWSRSRAPGRARGRPTGCPTSRWSSGSGRLEPHRHAGAREAAAEHRGGGDQRALPGLLAAVEAHAQEHAAGDEAGPAEREAAVAAASRPG